MSDRKASAILAGSAVVAFALHLATIGLYSYHRDELYLLACGKHLAWGSVDHAPITPALSRLTALLLGITDAGVRTRLTTGS